MSFNVNNWWSLVHREVHKILKDEIAPIVNQVDVRVIHFEMQYLKEAANFVRDFKSLEKEADESLDKITILEKENEHLLRAVASQDILYIVKNSSVVDTSDLQTELERTKEKFEFCTIKKENEYAKLWNEWYTKVYNNAKNRKPQPRSNTKNDRVPSTSKSSSIKNKDVENDKSEVVCDMCCQNLFMVLRLRLLQAHDQESEATHQRRVEVYGNSIATACYTQNYSLNHQRFNKTPYELINDRKPDISFLHVFGALCYPKNDREDIGKLGAKGDIGFFIGYYATSCAYRVYNQRTRIIMETMNVTFDELSTMGFEQRSLKPELQGMTYGHISSRLNLTYASSTITSQKPTEHELDLLFEAMYDDYIGGQPSDATKTAPIALATQNLQTPNASMTTADSAPTPTNSSSQAPTIPKT
ncbi:retrovirus-related pol polyprotein from transposon TNT 1-94 [Tanacetum coccineum]